MVAPAFFLKVLVLEGSAPVLECACPAARRTPTHWSPSTWSRAGSCAGLPAGPPAVARGLVLLRRTLVADWPACWTSPLAGTDEVTALATEAMEAHLDRRLRSVRTGPVG